MKEAVITSSVLVIGILLLRRVLRGKISARLQYALWLLVALRLILPAAAAVFPEADMIPKSNFSIMNMAQKNGIRSRYLFNRTRYCGISSASAVWTSFAKRIRNRQKYKYTLCILHLIGQFTEWKVG